MNLEKLKIVVEDGAEIEALFNPNQIVIDKSVNWRLVPTAERDVPASQFTYGDPATLTIDLFFDTYEDGSDVRQHTDKILHLTTIEQHGDLHRPPLCELTWGKLTFDTLKWVLQQLKQTFTLFLADGTPVRATLACTFRQWRSDELEAKLLNKQSADVPKSHVVRHGDRLSSIAAAHYRDPARWRAIAEANGIDNPRALRPGQVLQIPTLVAGSQRQR